MGSIIKEESKIGYYFTIFLKYFVTTFNCEKIESIFAKEKRENCRIFHEITSASIFKLLGN